MKIIKYTYITMKSFPLSRLEVMHRYFEPGIPKPTCMIIKKNKESKVGCVSGAFYLDCLGSLRIDLEEPTCSRFYVIGPGVLYP